MHTLNKDSAVDFGHVRVIERLGDCERRPKLATRQTVGSVGRVCVSREGSRLPGEEAGGWIDVRQRPAAPCDSLHQPGTLRGAGLLSAGQ